jgi:ADP-L-glycero-D-manno-heptose 6-epimerase
MIFVTGGAGFIGSNLVAALTEREHPVIVCDRLGREGKWQNLAKRELADILAPEAMLAALNYHKAAISKVVHLGAITSTSETDADAIIGNNFILSHTLWRWCTANEKPLIYASSAATYGDGEAGFADDERPAALARLRPRNPYGWSKHLFDRRIVRAVADGEKRPPQWVGLKFFNVYGPNEYHKGAMMSVLCKVFDDAKAGNPVRLFKSHRDGIADGEQRRDFIYVDDVTAVMRWLLETPSVCGLFNVGTGKARSFRDLISALFRALGLEPKIEYIDMPENIRGQYQYFTKAKVENLLRAGYNAGFTPLEDGVNSYVAKFLNTADRYR